MLNKQKKTKLNLIKILIVAIIILSVIILFYLVVSLKKINISTTNTADSNQRQVDVGNEINKIKDDNKSAIEEAQKVAVQTVRVIDEMDHIMGDINAPAQLIIYNDFECPFCANFYHITEEIKKYFGENIVIAFRHFPLTMHPLSFKAALASECAAEQGKFWEMYDKLFINNEENIMSVKEFKKDAVDLGLDAEKFNQCLDTEKYKDKIQAQIIEGKNFGITGTPGNFVDREPVPGARPFEDFVGSDGKKMEGMKSIIERHSGKQ